MTQINRLVPSDIEAAAADIRPGGLSRIVRKVLMKPATVMMVEHLGERYRLVTLHSPAFRGAAWHAGQKVQIAMGAGIATRTYTPADWRVADGTVRILASVAGDGPGSAWMAHLEPGRTCDVFGPRPSLALERVTAPIVVVGDATSIGLAGALRHEGRLHGAVFEVDDVAAARGATARLGLDDAVLVERRTRGTHRDDIVRELAAPAAIAPTFILTGNGPSIQHIRRGLKGAGVPSARLIAKAYWVPGKAGLD